MIDGLTPEQDGWFTTWWAAYWLHKAKKAARRAFGKHIKSSARFEQVMAATQGQAPEMLGRDPQHRPQGATWLNGERWEDEAAPDAQPKKPDAVSSAISEARRILNEQKKEEKQ